MKLTFHRAQVFEVHVQKPEFSRAFVFEVRMGIGKPDPAVDALSGMLLNLVVVDKILAELKDLWSLGSWDSLRTLLEKSQDFLQSRLEKENVFLQELCLLEKRGFWLAWKDQKLSMGGEEIRELEGGLYRLCWERPLVESLLEGPAFQVTSAQDLLGARIFDHHTDLLQLEVENLGNHERWRWVRARP